ncbi:atrial natriuretic peptide receptor 1 [Patella vulgata]|uniref:atrial natriuretic peptide receptor 1 n=1 Tax=Patella vulgata TaxID=6465 RepID=UPI00217FCFFB|nr:atrial natriuretic peptide receptor 1 [Patella vulgata]
MMWNFAAWRKKFYLKYSEMFFLILLFTLSTAKRLATVKIGVILPMNESSVFSLHKVMPAIELAVERVMTNTNLLNGRKIQVTYADSGCSETNGPLRAIEMHLNKTADVFLGPACNYALAPVARYSSSWNIPVITAGGLVTAFRDKSQYKLLTRVMDSYSNLGHFLKQTLNKYDLSVVALLYSNLVEGTGKSECFFTMEAIYRASVTNSKPRYQQFHPSDKLEAFKQKLMDISNHARVIILCGSPDSIREIMLAAHELDLDNGDYVFFKIDIARSLDELVNEKPWYRENDTQERNEAARKAYEALMIFTVYTPTSTEYKAFTREIKRRVSKSIMNPEEQVNLFVGAFHDAVLLYAMALNETLEAKGSISDGRAITARMWNRTFQGITGAVRIDENGDRDGDYSLLDLNPTSGLFEVVANYYGNRKRYEAVDGRMIHWAGGRTGPPTHPPKSGFDGSKCQHGGSLRLYNGLPYYLVAMVIFVMISAI